MDARGLHCLFCRQGLGRGARHSFLNDIIWRALTQASVPSTKEPVSLSRTDGKRPDRLTLIPWRSGKSAVWDVTITNTLANSYLNQSSVEAGSAAETASERKLSKYHNLSDRYEVIPVALETFGSANELG